MIYNVNIPIWQKGSCTPVKVTMNWGGWEFQRPCVRNTRWLLFQFKLCYELFLTSSWFLIHFLMYFMKYFLPVKKNWGEFRKASVFKTFTSCMHTNSVHHRILPLHSLSKTSRTFSGISLAWHHIWVWVLVIAEAVGSEWWVLDSGFKC